MSCLSDQAQYTVLVTVLIMSAVIPTLIGQAFFQPRIDVGTPSAFAPTQADEIEAAASDS